MTHASEPPPSGLDSLHCVSCGYDLRGLPTDRACPECGTPIERSLAGDRLAYADPAWLGRITRGQVLLALGARLCIFVFLGRIGLGMILGIVSAAVSANPAAAARTDLLERIAEWAGLLTMLGALLLAGVGALLVSEQEPRELATEKPWSPRALVRWGFGCAIAAIVVREFAAGQVTGPARLAISSALVVVIGVAVTVVSVGLLRYLASLAARVPDEPLEARATRAAATMRWALPTLIILPQAVHLRSLTAGVTGRLADIVSVFHGLLSCAVLIAGLVLIVHVFVVTSLLGDLRRALTACAELASGISPPAEARRTRP